MYRHKHHEESVEKMVEHYKQDKAIQALFLVGSVATQTERPDSDLDGVAVVDSETLQKKRAEGALAEVIHGKCTYEGGYFDVSYMDKESLKKLITEGSEPMRNKFNCARVLFCDDDELVKIVEQIPTFPQEKKEEMQKKFYCTFKQFHRYFWNACKPTGFMRHHVAQGMVFNLYRLILLENDLLFPSMRMLEDAVIRAENKPAAIVEQSHNFLKTMTDEDAQKLIDSYESWTKYEYPTEHKIIMNGFSNPLEWF